MFQAVIALSMAVSSESVDGIIFNRSSSCSGGSCSSSAKPAEPATVKPQEIKSPKVTTEAVGCGRQPVESIHRKLKNRTAGFAKRCR